MYRYAALDPRNTPEAIANNDRILGDGADVLGIEVTVPELAARCGLGNIDPQHSGGGPGMAAIQAAQTCPLPPEGTMLATVRPDADSVGAMAVLEIRAKYLTKFGKAEWGRESSGWSLVRFAHSIAEGDTERSGQWPGPHPLQGSQQEYRLRYGDFAVANAAAMDHTVTLAERVELLRGFVENGVFPGITGYEDIQRRLHRSRQDALASLNAVERDGVAVVVGNHRLAMELGYSLSPVVVATNPEFQFNGGAGHRKHTIARWNSTHHMDWDGLRTALQAREPGWGGSSSIMGSPQGTASQLTTEAVAELVIAHLTPEGGA